MALRVAITLEQCWHRVPGGVARSALDSASALVRHTDLELVGVAARHPQPPPAPFVPPIPVAQLGLPRLALYESWHRRRRPPVQDATGPVDVIHATGMAVPPRSAPLVVTVHDLAFLHEPEHFTRRGVRFFQQAIDLARRDADVVVCPSQATIDECLENGFAPDRLRLVPWGAPPRTATADDVARVRAVYDLPERFVLWTGTIEPRKNLPRLVAAVGRLDPPVELVLAGPTGWRESLEEHVAASGARVRALGFVPERDLPALYATADVFAYPSLREGFGLPVLEAMRQGTPVVTSAGTATAEVAGEAGLLVEPTDVAGLAEALQSVLDDGERAAALGEAGRARAETFSWERAAGLLRAVYEEAAGRSVAIPPTVPRPSVLPSSLSPDAVHGAVSVSGGGGSPTGAGTRQRRAVVGVNLLWLVPGVVGGSEEYTVRLLRELARLDPADLRVVLFVNRSFPAAHGDLLGSFETRVAPLGGTHKGLRVGAETTWLGRAVRGVGADVTHHAGGVMPPWRPTSTLLTVHDLQPLAMPQHFGLVKRTFLRAGIGPSVRRADLVVTLSAFTRDDLVARVGCDPTKVRIVPCGVHPPPPQPAVPVAEVRRRHGLGERPYFLYPAITYPHKNHIVLVEALARVVRHHPDVMVVLTGGAAGSEETVLDSVHALGLDGAVRRTGRIPEDDLDALYRGATALVFPSRYEGFGLPALEAMNLGCPVIGAQTTSLPEVLGGAGILVSPDDPEAWAEAMVLVLDDPVHRQRLVDAGRDRARAYDWDRSAAALADAYREVAGSASSRAVRGTSRPDAAASSDR
ncbi:MAG: glycosyltransferase family 4 protein [Acidimicrobiales bacterium]|jgi:glycosyltransferase involved in cell wall biosynthesis|nr:glycosyltransferase family 4 protein [Acidimicrobiales bacterium]